MLRKITFMLIVGGWFSIFIFFPFGNTSLGILLLLFGGLLGIGNVDFKKRSLNVEHWLLLLLSIVMILSAINSVKPLESLAVSVGQILLFIVVFLGARFLVLNKEHMSNYLICLYVSGVVSGFVVLYRYINAPEMYFRSETLFTGVNGTGTVLMVTMALSLFFIDRYATGYKKISGYILLVLPLVGLLTSFSRGAWIGFSAVLLIFFARSKKGIIAFLVLAILIVSIASATVYNFESRLLSIFSLEKNSIRLEVWKASLRMVKDNLLLGVGPGMFAYNFPEYRPDTFRYQMTMAHNLELHILSELGIAGFLLYFTFLFFVLMRNIQLIYRFPDKILYRGVFAALVGFLLHNQVDGTMLGFEIGSFFWLLCGYVIASYYLSLEEECLNDSV